MNDTKTSSKPQPKPNTPETPQSSPSSPAEAARQAVPPLEFTNPPKQPVGQVFNTFRVGKKWADRVKPGDTLTVKQTGGEPVGEAEVVDVHTGSWDQVKAFAADNHQYGHFGLNEAQELLRDDLKRHYGSDFTDKAVLTVLYLRRA